MSWLLMEPNASVNFAQTIRPYVPTLVEADGADAWGAEAGGVGERTGQHVARVVGRLGRSERHVAVEWVHAHGGGGDTPHTRRHIAEPLQHGLHALLVVVHQRVRHAVGDHDLRAAQLVLARVHLCTPDTEKPTCSVLRANVPSAE